MAKGNIKVLQVESNLLKGNPLGDPHIRDLYVYLPPEYKASNKRFPVVFALSGFTGRGRGMLNDNFFSPDLGQRLNHLIGSGVIKPMIVAMPDCTTRFGGSQYINSAATGNYEDHLIEELVPLIDRNFRTLNCRDSRAVVGKSSGGYGALVMSMRHADIFSAACSIAGDCYFDLCYRSDFGKALRGIAGDPLALVNKMLDEAAPKGKNDFDGLNIIGMSSCYSPDPASSYGFRIPFCLETGELDAATWERWLAQDPVNMVKEHSDALRSMRLIFLDAGTNDEFFLDLGARILSKQLASHDVRFVHEEFGGGHFNINYRYDRSFQLISEALIHDQ